MKPDPASPAGPSIYIPSPGDLAATRHAASEARLRMGAMGRSGAITVTIEPQVVAEAVRSGVEAALKGSSSGGSGLLDSHGDVLSSTHSAGHASLPKIPGARGEGLGSGGYKFAYRRGTYGDIKAEATTAIGRRLEEAGRKTWAPPVIESSKTDPITGSPIPVFHKQVQNDDGTVSKIPISADEAATLTKRGRKLTAAAGALKGIGEPGGAFGGIASAVPELGPMMAGAAAIVGAPIAIDKGLQFIQNQRQANTQYQSIYGGSNMAGMGQRFRGETFRLGQLGTLSDSQAQEAFMGASQTGLQGGARDNATNFIVSQYKKIGMSIKEGVEAVTIAAQTGNSSLTGLAEALDGVTKSAKAAGVNANVARQNFLKIYQDVAQTIPGNQAVGIAGGLASAQTNMGRQMQGADLSGFNKPMTQRLMAAQSGLSYNQYLSQAQGQNGANFVAGSEDKVVLNFLKTSGMLEKFMPYATMVAQAAKDRNGQPNDDDYNTAVAAALADHNIPDASIISQGLSRLLGITFASDDEAVLFVIKHLVGQVAPGALGSFNVSNATQANQKKSASGQVVQGATPQQVTAIQKTNAKGLNNSQSAKDIQSARDAAGSTDAGWLSSGNSQTRRANQNYYKNNVVNKNEKDPILAELLKRSSSNDLFTVQTKDGPRDVNMHDLERYYRDQVQAGTVKFATGANAGQSVTQFTNMTPSQDDINKANASNKQASKNRALQGQDRTDAANKTNAGGISGKIIIEPTAELKRYLNITSTSGNVVVSDSIYNGVAPPSTVQPGFSPAATQGG